jgi:hypothetical protein
MPPQDGEHERLRVTRGSRDRVDSGANRSGNPRAQDYVRTHGDPVNCDSTRGRTAPASNQAGTDDKVMRAYAG